MKKVILLVAVAFFSMQEQTRIIHVVEEGEVPTHTSKCRTITEGQIKYDCMTIIAD